MDMRGLAHFIRDIRAATGNKTREERRVDEELAKIRAKFVDTHHMSTYDRKKYVCKLMFIAMLGYPIEFGHIEGIKLMADESPAAKLIGYISTTVLVNEYSELLTLTTHTVYRDLLSGVDFNQGLALTAIANAGGKDFAEVMHDGVQNIVLDGSVGMHIRQKAILALLRVYRKYPEVVDLPSVVPKVLELMDSAPSGVCMCAITFIAACVESSGKSTSLYDEIPSKLIRVLERIIVDKDTEPGYVYYGVPAPWLQSKALRLLQSLPPPADRGLRTRIEAVLRKVLKATEKVLKDAQAQQRQRGTQNRVNAMNAVLVEVVSLCITWDLGSNFTVDCANLISGFISEKREANLRYVGLTLLARLSMSQSPAFHFASYCRQLQPQIIVSLHDRDGSLRRRALHVLEEMCNSSNARDILQELQSYVPVVMDVDFRRCLVLSIARLADRYCVDDTPWHVDVLLGLIAQAGECCPSKIAHRVVRLIVNTPAVQKRAANVAFRTLASGVDGHPTLLQTVAFILGEFGYQIALSAESTPIRQLLLLQRHLAFTSVSTQGIILAAFMKWYPMYDDADVRTQIEDTLSSFADSTHPELQQRANEYRALIHHGSLPLLEKVLGAMPPFPREAESAYSSHPTTRLSASHRSKSSQNPNVSSEGVPAPQLLLNRPEDGLVSLSQLDALWSSPDSGDAHAVLQLYTQRRAWFKGMLMSNVEGVLFEDDHLHITCRQVNCGADSRLTLRVTNVSSEAIAGMTLQVQEVEGGLRVQLRPASALVDPLPARASATVEIATRCGQPFAHPPSVGVSYRDATGEFHMEVLSLPVAVTRFIVPYVAGSGESLLETVKRLQNSLPPPLSIMVDHKGRLNLQLVENLLSRTFLCGVVRGQAAGSVVVVGALASQLGAGPVLHDPVVLELRVGESEVHADVCASSPALQTAILAVVELLLEA